PLPPAGWQERVAEALAALAGRLPAEDGRARLTLTAGPAPEHGDPAAAPSGPASLFLSVSPLAADAAPAQAVTARFAGPPAPAPTSSWWRPVSCGLPLPLRDVCRESPGP
ncbi:MAG: hypothetical protein O7A07_00300, partial [Acidobacteria bacterium]|nr:hypothetical protein [Acidobacteriota bacterium]